MNRSTEQRDAEVLKTLNILDDMPSLRPHHLFRAHLLQHIETLPYSGREARAISSGFNPRLAFMAVLLVINIASAGVLFMPHNPEPAGNLVSEVSEPSIDDYASPALSYYDLPVTEQAQSNE
jgi:hypothetical protein